MNLRRLNMALILKDGYYVDSNNNKWSADKYTPSEWLRSSRNAGRR